MQHAATRITPELAFAFALSRRDKLQDDRICAIGTKT